MSPKNIIHALKELLVGKNLFLMGCSIVVGILWFSVETSFVFIIQLFLVSIGVLNQSQINLPSWINISIETSMLSLILFGVLRALLIYSKSFLGFKLYYNLIHDLRVFFVNQNIDNSKYSTSQFLSFFGEKINQTGLFVQNISLFLVSFLVSFFFVLICFKIAPYEMAFCLVFLVLLMLPVKLKSQEIHKIGDFILNKYENVFEDITLIKKNIFLLKVYNKLNQKVNEVKNSLGVTLIDQSKYAKNFSILISLPVFLGIFILGVCSYFSVKYFHTEGVVLLSFFYLFLRFSVGVSELNHYNSLLQLNYSGFSEVFEFVRTTNINNNSIKSKDYLLSKQNLNQIEDIQSIEMKNLFFQYSTGQTILNNINLKLSKGQILVVQGVSGSGKSSLIKLILGIEKVSSGDIFINDIKVNNLNHNWKSIVGYVGSEPYMIRGTLRDNLLFGIESNADETNSKKTDLELINSLKQVNLYDELAKQNFSLDSVLDEIAFLSTGQKQRISIARNFLRKSKLLILDEATSNLDKENESLVFKYVNEYKKDSIVILITHEPELTKYADVILKLQR